VTKQRISKKLLAQYPSAVQDYINDWKGKGYVKSVTVSHEQAPYTLYNGEGYRFFVYHNGKSMHSETVSESTLGIGGLNHDICGSTQIPANTIIVEVSYYQGFRMRITHVDPVAIEA
jgi:hypothetical protein